MRKIADIDVLADAVLQARMVRLSLLMLAAGLAAAVLVLVAEGGRELGLGWLLALAVASVASLPAHELVHGAAFKLLCPGARVSFGVKDAFLYTSASGAVVPRGRELAASSRRRSSSPPPWRLARSPRPAPHWRFCSARSTSPAAWATPSWRPRSSPSPPAPTCRTPSSA